MSKGRRVREYTDEDKQCAYQLYLAMGTATAVAAELGIPKRTVQHWAKVGNWDGDPDIAEERLAEALVPVREEKQPMMQAQGAPRERKAQLMAQAQDALGDTLGKVPKSRIRGRGEASVAALNLAKVMMVLEGKPSGDSDQRPFTLQQLIFIATGSEGERIAGSIEDSARSRILPAGDSGL